MRPARVKPVAIFYWRGGRSGRLFRICSDLGERWRVARFAALIWGPSARMLTNRLLGAESKS